MKKKVIVTFSIFQKFKLITVLKLVFFLIRRRAETADVCVITHNLKCALELFIYRCVNTLSSAAKSVFFIRVHVGK